MEDTTIITDDAFETQWGIVEVMGHQRFAGMVSQRSIFGTVFCQVDVPELPAYTDRWGNEQPSQSGFSKLIGGSAIFAITPTTEEVARAAARSNSKAVNVYIGETNPMPARQLVAVIEQDEYDNTDDGRDPLEDPFANG